MADHRDKKSKKVRKAEVPDTVVEELAEPEGKPKRSKEEKQQRREEKEKKRQLKAEHSQHEDNIILEESSDKKSSKKRKREAAEANVATATASEVDTVTIDHEAEKKERKRLKKEKKDKKDKKNHQSVASDELAPESQEIVMKDAPNGHGMKNEAEPTMEPTQPRETPKSNKKEKKKKQKQPKHAAAVNGANQGEDHGGDSNELPDAHDAYMDSKKTRFIAFIGNLPFTATKADIEQHFKSISPSSVRLMTNKDSGTSRGFGFVEFDRYDHMKSCLQLYHHSVFSDGKSPVRKINVELTAGGGGSKTNRMDKIKAKNEKLQDERQRRVQRQHDEKKQRQNGVEPQHGTEQQNVKEDYNGAEDAVTDTGEGMHPSRLARLRR